MISTLVGLLVVRICGPAVWAAALAVGLAMIAMHLTGTFYPPAGIDPLVVATNNMSWSFLFAPVGIGALLLTLSHLLGTISLREEPTRATSGASDGGSHSASYSH